MSTFKLLVPLALALWSAPAVQAAQADAGRIAALRADASAVRDETERAYAAEMPACYERFLVNRCIAQAKARRVEGVKKARALDIEATRLELAEKQRQAAAQVPAASRPADPVSDVPASAASSESSSSHGVPAARGTPAAPPATTGMPEADAEALRQSREREAARAQAGDAAGRAQKEAERTAERDKAEAAAAARAEKAARDRERYDERLKKHQQKQQAQPQ